MTDAEKPDKEASIIGPDHPIAVLATQLAHPKWSHQICARAGLSKWEFCEAMANACGQILANSQNMPREHALDRMDSLREVMQGAYDLFGCEGEA